VKRGRAFTLVEVLLATVLLAALVIACLPMMRSPGPIAAVPTYDPRLAELAVRSTNGLPLGQLQRFDSTVGEAINGSWVVVQFGDRYTVVWVKSESVTEVAP
jgi:hypothetical protein